MWIICYSKYVNTNFKPVWGTSPLNNCCQFYRQEETYRGCFCFFLFFLYTFSCTNKNGVHSLSWTIHTHLKTFDQHVLVPNPRKYASLAFASDTVLPVPEQNLSCSFTTTSGRHKLGYKTTILYRGSLMRTGDRRKSNTVNHSNGSLRGVLLFSR